MIILLAGSTFKTRNVVADAFMGEHPEWRHLAFEAEEDLEDGSVDPLQEMFQISLGCQCALDLEKDGFDLLVTCPSYEAVTTFQKECPGSISVHLGAKERASHRYDHVLDTAKTSTKHTVQLLEELIGKK